MGLSRPLLSRWLARREGGGAAAAERVWALGEMCGVLEEWLRGPLLHLTHDPVLGLDTANQAQAMACHA